MQRWIECSRQLGQWPVLSELAASVQQWPELSLEAAWKEGNSWESVRAQLTTSPALLAPQEQGSPWLKVMEAHLAVAELAAGVAPGQQPQGPGAGPAASSRALSLEVDKLLGQCWQLALHRWQLLPRLFSGCPSHRPLLHVFQQLQQLKESMALLDEAAAHARQGAVPNLRNSLKSWRERLPNDCDSLAEWDDIVAWRLQVRAPTDRPNPTPLSPLSWWGRPSSSRLTKRA